ncbi:hypothetical protein AB1E18_003129 [Capra hircus]
MPLLELSTFNFIRDRWGPYKDSNPQEASGPLLARPPGGFRGLSEAEGSCILQRSGILEAMKHVLNLYLLGGVLTLLSIFVRLMESLEGLLESPSPGSSWATRGKEK